MKTIIFIIVFTLILYFVYYLFFREEFFIINRADTVSMTKPQSAFYKSVTSASVVAAQVFLSVAEFYKTYADTVVTPKLASQLKDDLKFALKQYINSSINLDFCNEFRSSDTSGLFIPNLAGAAGATFAGGGVLNRRHEISYRNYNNVNKTEVIHYPIEAEDIQAENGFHPVEVKLYTKGAAVYKDSKASSATREYMESYNEFLDQIVVTSIPNVYSIKNETDSFQYNITMNRLRIDLPDPLHEMIVSSYLNYLFNENQCPHLTKIYGAYFCNDQDQSSSRLLPLLQSEINDVNIQDNNRILPILISERASFSLKEFIRQMNKVVTNFSQVIKEIESMIDQETDQSAINQMIVELDMKKDELKSIVEIYNVTLTGLIIQFFYTFAYIKKMAKVRHFDLHLMNILVDFVDRKYFDFEYASLSPDLSDEDAPELEYFSPLKEDVIVRTENINGINVYYKRSPFDHYETIDFKYRGQVLNTSNIEYFQYTFGVTPEENKIGMIDSVDTVGFEVFTFKYDEGNRVVDLTGCVLDLGSNTILFLDTKTNNVRTLQTANVVSKGTPQGTKEYVQITCNESINLQVGDVIEVGFDFYAVRGQQGGQQATIIRVDGSKTISINIPSFNRKMNNFREGNNLIVPTSFVVKSISKNKIVTELAHNINREDYIKFVNLPGWDEMIVQVASVQSPTELTIDFKYEGKIEGIVYIEKVEIRHLEVQNMGFILKNIDFGHSSVEIPLNGNPNAPADYTKFNPEFHHFGTNIYRFDQTNKLTATNKSAYITNEPIFFLQNVLRSLRFQDELGFKATDKIEEIQMNTGDLRESAIQTYISDIETEVDEDRSKLLVYNIFKIFDNLVQYDDTEKKTIGTLTNPILDDPDNFVYPENLSDDPNPRAFYARRDTFTTDLIDINQKPITYDYFLNQIWENNRYFFSHVSFEYKTYSNTSIIKLTDFQENIDSNDMMMEFNAFPQPSTKFKPTFNVFVDSLIKRQQVCLGARRQEQTEEDCIEASIKTQKFNPNTTFNPPLTSRDLVNDHLILEDPDMSSSNTSYFYFNLNPGVYLEMEPDIYTLYNSKKLTPYVLSPDIGFLNSKPVPDNLRDTYYPSVNLHIMKVSQNTNPYMKIVTNLGLDLWDAMTVSNPKFYDAVCFNGGYFIVPGNVKDNLQLFVGQSPQYSSKNEAIKKPIGFYKTTNRKTGVVEADTIIEFPLEYQEWIAAIYIVNDKIKMMRYDEFKLAHRQREISQTIELLDTPERIQSIFTTYAIDVEYTGVVVDDEFKYNGEPKIIKGMIEPYTDAFVSGPILIWDGVKVFTKEVCLVSRFQTVDLVIDLSTNSSIAEAEKAIFGNNQVENSGYRVSEFAFNDKMFKSEQGESQYPFGMRHSGNLIQVNAICELTNGDIVIIQAESRGYDAYGITRYQFASIIETIRVPSPKGEVRVKNAVSLDGGFSAQILMCYDGNYTYALPDPDKRDLGISITVLDNTVAPTPTRKRERD
jgi:hypothetical protein